MTQMKLSHYIYLTSLVLAAACSGAKEPVDPDAFGPVKLQAGLVESSRTATKADPARLALKAGTKAALQVSGTWTGHDPVNVIDTTVATVQAGSTSSSDLVLSPQLFWDDFGTADAANKETGRAAGLTVYGVAVDGASEAPGVSDYTALEWDVLEDQSTGWSGKDLLISNNVKGENTYKFASRTGGKLLDFCHALTKITVNLKAGAGFTGGQFVKAPTVTLLDWAHTNGTVNATSGAVILGTDTGVTMYQAATATPGNNVTKEALVMPGSPFVKGADILKINADGNIYYVSSEKIRTAIDSGAHDTDDLAEAGKNYIINVLVNKTGIVVTATVKDWTDVNSEEVHPVINVSTSIGGGADKPAGANTFAFYRSETIDKDYVNAAQPEMEPDGTVDWTHTTTLYWTSHFQHYHFRGIYPSATPVQTDASDNTQYVEVSNGAFDASAFPGNFLMGMPEIAAGTLCDNPDHTPVDMSTDGICAREAAINLNFRYMMSQVEVVLSSSAESSHDHVDLSSVKVQLVDVYNSGRILMEDRSAVVSGNPGDFELPQTDAASHKYLGVVVPQALGSLRFRITVTNSDSSLDVYYADIQPIKVKLKGSSQPAATVDAWEGGKHYVYNLKVTKTEIKTSASLTDWATYEAGADVWF